MKSLVDLELCAREFGRHAVRVSDLRVWAVHAGAVLPATDPAIDEFDVVALESLLCAFQRGVPMWPDRAVVSAAKLLAFTPEAQVDISNVSVARWLVAAEVPVQWRKRLKDAVGAGELKTVDAVTGLPLLLEPQINAEEGDPTDSQPAVFGPPPISTDELCEAFDGVKFTSLKWRTKIDKGAPEWLIDCRAIKGTGGASPRQATWWPIKIAGALLLDEGPHGPRPDKRKVRSAFNTQPALKPWREAWAQYCEENHLNN